ncbi:MAG: DUF6638 family protein [Patescibacteria group bacterium]
MRELTRTALVGGGLILIDRPETIKRYRVCMEQLGLTPTTLDHFHIDGIGWSPEIADEFQNRYYLSHGLANPRGIIVTINQENQPIYMPAHSFDRLMMQRYFEKNREAIANLTAETGIALEIDQRVTWYRKLTHVESLRTIKIVSHAGTLADKAIQQKQLVGEFMREDTDAWMDTGLRKKIIKDLNENGKLYDRQLVIDDFTFSEFDDFYTAALGGVYVFRHQRQRALIVVENEKLVDKAGAELVPYTTHVRDPNVVSRIRESGVADIDVRWYQTHPHVLQERLATLGLFILSTVDPEIPVDTMTDGHAKGALSRCKHPFVDVYAELEEFAVKITEDQVLPTVSSEVQACLLHPVNTSTRHEENLVWRLICHVQAWPVDVMRLYAVDKNLFLDRYQTWSKPMRAVARKQIVGYNSDKTYTERK